MCVGEYVSGRFRIISGNKDSILCCSFWLLSILELELDGNHHSNVNGHMCIQIFFFSWIATSISTKMILRECVEYHAHLLVVHNMLNIHMSPLLTIILVINLPFTVTKWVLSVPPPKKQILYPIYVGRDLQAPDTTLPINTNDINS